MKCLLRVLLVLSLVTKIVTALALSPSLSPSIRSTDGGNYSSLLTSTSSSAGCADLLNWVDIYGSGCDSYEVDEEPGCPLYGNDYSDENGVTASDACCYCGGGGGATISTSPSVGYAPSVQLSDAPTMSPLISSAPTTSTTVSSVPSTQASDAPSFAPNACFPYEGWENKCPVSTDSISSDFDSLEEYCNTEANPLTQVIAKFACCVCGGGRGVGGEKEQPSVSPAAPVSLCRDKGGLDCYNHLPNPLAEYEFFKVSAAEDLIMVLEGNCCLRGGGDRSVNWRILKELMSLNATTYESVKVPASPAMNAFFWLTTEDKYSISYKSEWLTQRFVLVLLYHHWGGATRWKTCWSGQRYSDHDTFHYDDWGIAKNYYNSTAGYLQNYTDECASNIGGGTAWLSPVHECEWAFVECDRHNFVIGLHMRE